MSINHGYKHLINASLTSSILFLSGCATIFNNGAQVINAKSSDGKKVAIDVIYNTERYSTTLPVKIIARPSSNNDIHIEINDPCYAGHSTLIKKSITSSYYANILNIHGLYIDYLSGYMWEYANNKIIPTTPHALITRTCAQQLQQTVTENDFSQLNLTTQGFGKHVYSFGFIPSAAHYDRDYDTDGFYIQYQYALSAQWRIQIRSIDISMGCEYGEYDAELCPVGYAPFTEQNMWTLGVNYYPTGSTGLYVGAGVGSLEVRQGFSRTIDFSSTTVSNNAEDRPLDSYAELIPIYIDVGYDIGSSVRLKLFGSLSLSRLGLGPPLVIKQNDNTDLISDPDLKHQTKRLFSDAKNYSALGFGIEMHY